MTQVFLSYSTKDHHFAELLSIQMKAAEIKLWRDIGELRAGTGWREGIEEGIADSIAVIVALSENSAASSYVTFEWAYAMGMQKAIIPIKLTECDVHAKLKPIQYLDFTVPGKLPWESLVERIQEIDIEEAGESQETDIAPQDVAHVEAIISYLNQRGFRMASFERLRKNEVAKLTDDEFQDFIKRNKTVFRRAMLKGKGPGIAKLRP